MSVVNDVRQSYVRNMGPLPGDYVAGFVDGEDCFALKFVRDVKYKRKNAPEYFY